MKKMKKILIFSSLILLVLLSVILLNKDYLSERFQSTVYYLKLNSDRQELYNKLEIVDVSIKARKTGTAPFNNVTASDLNGNDISANDNYVRTSDKIEYTLEFAINHNTNDNANIDPSLTGGVIKVRATLPNQGQNPNLTWAQDAWMKNVTISEDATVITAEFVSTNESMVNTMRNLSFTVLVGGYKTQVNSNMLPEFEIWMEGNKPDNASSTAQSVKIKDTKSIFISGTPSYNVVLAPDYGTLLKTTKRINGIEMPGRYKNIAVGVALRKLDGMTDYRGVEYPTNEFNIALNLKYYYSIGDTGSYTGLTTSSPNAIDILNGTIIQSYGINGDLTENYYPNFEATSTIQRLPFGKLAFGDSTNSVVDSGTMTASLSGNILSIKFKDYKVGETFPIYPSNLASSDDFDRENAYFLSGLVELFIPFYGSQNTDNAYFIDITAESAQYKLRNGTTGTINSNGTSIADKNTSDNKYRLTFENYLSGIYSYGIYTYTPQWDVLETPGKHYGDASVQIGDNFNMTYIHGLMDGEFEGGISTLLAWDANMIGIRSIGTTWVYVGTTTETDYLPPIDNVTMTYGIYNANPSKGLTTLDEINAAVYADFTWYSTYDEASRNGVVTAVYIDDPDMKGNQAARRYNTYYTLLNKKENIGKTAVIRGKVYAYENADRTRWMYFRTGTYSPTTYDENGTILSYENDWGIGKTILATSNNTSVKIESYQNDQLQNKFDIKDGNITYKITPTLTSNAEDSGAIDKTYIYVTLPNGLKYYDGSSNKKPESVVENADGSTTITYLYENWYVNEEPPEYSQIIFEAEISSDTINNAIYDTKAVISNTGDLRDEATHRTSISSIKVINLSGVQLNQNIDKKIIEKGQNVINTIQVGNSSSSDIKNVRTAEILPKASNGINGEYTITVLSLATNQKMYFSTADIDTLGLIYENNRYNAQSVDLTSSNWTEVKVGDTIPENATIIISKFDKINVSDKETYTYRINTDNAHGGDQYVFTTNLSSSDSNIVLKNNTLSFSVINRVIQGNIISAEGNNDIPDNINVHLLDENKTIIKSTTAIDYKYSFDSLNVGNYYISFEIPNNYEVSNTLTNTADSTGTSHLITQHNTNTSELEVKVENIDIVLARKKATLTVNHYLEGTTTELTNTITKTMNFGDNYKTEASTDLTENYELVSTPENAIGVINGNTTVTYYYRLKTATITVHHYIDGTTTKLVEDVITTQKYTTTYNTKPATVDQKYELVSTPNNATGIVNGNVTVTYYYKLKTATLTIHHYIEGTTTELSNTTTQTMNWGETYQTEPATDISDNYELATTPENATGVVNGNIIVTYYYRLKKATITVHHYIEGTTTKLAEDVITTQKYTTTYSTNPAIVDYNYKLVSTPENATGVVSSNVTVIYYYKLKTATLTINHYIEGTTTALSNTTIKAMNWGETYQTEPATDISDNYELVNIPVNASGIVGGDIIVNYYYKLKDGELIVHHYLNGTTTELSNSTTKPFHWGDQYSTNPATDISNNYELVSTPSNATGTINSYETIVIYYYQLKTATLTINYYDEGTTNKLSKTITKTMNWGERYQTESATDISNNYELVSIPSNASGTISGDVTINYYYRLKNASLTINYYIEGTTTKVADSITQDLKWGEKYETSPSSEVSNNYELVSTPENATGTIGDNYVIVNYYYRLKTATLTVNHYVEGTTNKLVDSEISTVYWGNDYQTEASTNVSNNYELVSDPENASGTISGNVTVNYYYKLKKGTITVHHYIEGTTTKLAEDVITTQNYTTTYSTSAAIVDQNYELVNTPENASGTINGDVIVNYYYKLKTATLKIHHYIEGTTTSLVADEIINVVYTQIYETTPSNDISNNYELANVVGNTQGVVSGNIEVIYYYKLKTSTLIIKHLEYGTNAEIVPSETKTLKYTEEYETKISSSIPENYEYYSKTDNYKGIVSSDNIEVIYYYQRKDSQLSTTISITAPSEISSKTQTLDYKVEYTSQIKDYHGPATITITAHVPYHIDEEKSNLNGGTYNSDTKTITWTTIKDDINASNEQQEINIVKEFSLVFSNLSSSDRTMNTSVTSSIKLDNNERFAENTTTTYIKILGKIIVHHYLEGSKVKIVEDVETTNLVGENYVSSQIQKEGYILKKEPQNKNHQYQDEVTEIIYEYERKKFTITTKIEAGKGEIKGDETVFFGDNSTEGNIVIKPNDGYIVSRIIINGEEKNIDQCKNGCILNSFLSVQEDKEIIVLFEEISNNPNTSSIITIFTITGLIILSTGTFTLTKKYKPSIKKI